MDNADYLHEQGNYTDNAMRFENFIRFCLMYANGQVSIWHWKVIGVWVLCIFLLELEYVDNKRRERAKRLKELYNID